MIACDNLRLALVAIELLENRIAIPQYELSIYKALRKLHTKG